MKADSFSFWDLDGRMDRQRFSSTWLDEKREQSAGPRTSIAHPSASLRSLEPQVYVFDGFSDLCILISHVWSPFHGCGASV